ncbi:hypothetical protein AVEN_229531-1 [Araneus ventricosus]|uniref:Uncharacterized protein n=1 Tax=Araneus ventricosus TaxID=182803 RepID=A0A4Y2EHQ3_ARAVE|nr:hypothetical protein AVEN_229531-1 [Araneus ventricosus]
MALTFLPSLKHLAAVRVALTVYNDGIIHFLDEVILREKYDLDDPFNVNIKEERWIRESQLEVRNKLSKLLPNSLENRVVHILQAIVAEIHYWIRDHFHVIKHIEKSHYKNSLRWKWEGTIDRIKTAKQLLRNESIDKRVRFVMACIYFRETDVLHLWQSMAADERQSIFHIDHNIAIRFWMEWLKENAKSPWTQCVPKYLTFDFLKRIASTSRVRVSSFFIELNTRNKILLLYCLWATERAHIDDLHLCYNLLDEAARAKIVPSFLRPIDVLCCYLDWPLQSLFLDAVNQMKSHLKRHCFEYCLHCIVYKKLMRGMQDFDYLELLRDLWNQIPDSYKEEIQKQEIFTLVRTALSYDEKTNPRPIEELLKEYIKSTVVFLD